MVERRQIAIAGAQAVFDSGEFLTVLDRLIGYRTESQPPPRPAALRRYLTEGVRPILEGMGFSCRVVENRVSPDHPALIATRMEDPSAPTLLMYGHADVQFAYPKQWRVGLDPWRVCVEGDRWYGRGVADNKGQHLINIMALRQAIESRDGSLGFNVRMLVETGEEAGSPGLDALCADAAQELAADLFIGSDGPRLAADRPTVFLGSRGVANFSLTLALREGGHHSGNWGGLLRNPATILANAIASMVDRTGRILVPELRSGPIPEAVRRVVADLTPGQDGPGVDAGWGEPGLSPAERVFAANTLEVLALGAGDIDGPVNAIPGAARAHCQLRFVPGLDPAAIGPALRRHLDAHGFEAVQVEVSAAMVATGLDPDNPWVAFAEQSLRRTTGLTPALLPGIGGSLPNAPFAHTLGLPTIWIPHSYPGCSQHAPNEHLPAGLIRESLAVMAGVFSDLADLPDWPAPPKGMPS